MKTEEYNKGVSFRITSFGFEALCRAVQSVPGVVLSKRRKFFWSVDDVGAEFMLQGHTFTISTDDWDGALWIMTKDGRKHADEMQTLRDTVESACTKPGALGNLWQCLITKTFK